jgi:murein DD-endopeptidase MepM/ murein hydrolase activator NlpD
MNIILVSNKMAKAKTLSVFQTALLVAAMVLVPVLVTLYFFTPETNNDNHKGVKSLFPMHLRGSAMSTQVHLDAYAKELGELQARIMRLDAQNQRLAKMAGVKSDVPVESGASLTPNLASQKPGSGGPLVRSSPMTEADLQAEIAALARAVDHRDDYLSSLEAKVLQQSVLKDMLPNSSPISAAFNSSSYGWRIDPFNGSKAFHEGLDFTANTGTPIRAAADGIVSEANRTPDYGNIVKIQHGSGLETRYAHASKLLVKVGERVVKGQAIALVGSTGRSTGPHLHYEIRLNGNALDPRKYLNS